VIKQVLAAIVPMFCFKVVEGSRIDRDFRVTMVPRYGLPMTIHGPMNCFKECESGATSIKWSISHGQIGSLTIPNTALHPRSTHGSLASSL
jgi:hypothetical protein